MSMPPLLRHETILGRYDGYLPGSAERAKSLGLKLWSETKCLVASLRLVRGTAGTIDREEAWLALGVASQAELVKELVGHVAGGEDVPVAELVATIRSRLSPAAASSGTAAASDETDASLVDAGELLDELKAAGVRVEARGDRLALLPASAVSEALVARVRPHKAGLLALLAARSRPARRGDRETPEEARVRQTAAIERLLLDRKAFVEEARKAGVYRGLATDTGDDVA